MFMMQLLYFVSMGIRDNLSRFLINFFSSRVNAKVISIDRFLIDFCLISAIKVVLHEHETATY